MEVQLMIGIADVLYRLSNGTAVMLRGTWEKCSPGQQQTHELRVLDHIVLGENDAAVCFFESMLEHLAF